MQSGLVCCSSRGLESGFDLVPWASIRSDLIDLRGGSMLSPSVQCMCVWTFLPGLLLTGARLSRYDCFWAFFVLVRKGNKAK